MKLDRMIGILSILLQKEKVTAPYEFAYDENQGDNGKRIEQCKCWKK